MVDESPQDPAEPTPEVPLHGELTASIEEGRGVPPAAEPSAPTPPVAAPQAHIETTPPEAVAALVASARAAQASWAKRPIEERARLLEDVRDRVLDRAASIAWKIHEETGKPEVEALLAEVIPTADLVGYWNRTIEELLEPVEVELDRFAYPGKTAWLYREARGVIALITPWNYPVAIPLRTLVPALLAGNAVVFKPSEVVPGTGAIIEGLFADLLPPGVLQVVQGGGDVGAALAAADVDLVVFTGSVASGRKVAHACAERVSPCALELGGKDAAIVLTDANLERAVNGIVWGALTNAGQNCASIERVYVEQSIAEELKEQVVVAVRALQVPLEVAPGTTAAQRAIVARHVEAAVSGGARVLFGSAASESEASPSGPMVLAVEDDDSPLMQDETFGPIIPIAVVADAEEAIRRANASRFGLTASIWTSDLRRGEELAMRLRAGTVTINNHAFTGALPAVPWSGHGETGYGITNSPLALDTLTRPRLVLTDARSAKRELWWYPYTPGLRTIALALATLRSGTSSIFAKAGALFRLLVNLPKRLF